MTVRSGMVKRGRGRWGKEKALGKWLTTCGSLTPVSTTSFSGKQSMAMHARRPQMAARPSELDSSLWAAAPSPVRSCSPSTPMEAIWMLTKTYCTNAV